MSENVEKLRCQIGQVPSGVRLHKLHCTNFYCYFYFKFNEGPVRLLIIIYRINENIEVDYRLNSDDIVSYKLIMALMV